jgi:UDP-glucose 4-epimerase
VPDDHRVTFVDGDLCEAKLADDIVPGHDFVIHAAAKNIIASTKDPYDDYETNIGSTLRLLLAARKYGVRRFVYTGSVSIYGNPEQLPIPEGTAAYPLSPYAASKLAGESYCTAFWEAYGVPTVVVRYSNVYGVNQDPTNPYCGVVAKFFESALRGAPFVVHGDGQQTRDFTYIDDAVEATLEALTNPRAISNVFNVGTGRETPVIVLAQKIAEISGVPLTVLHVENRDIDNVRRRVVNIERIRRSLRWSPRWSLEAGLQQTYEWMTRGR